MLSSLSGIPPCGSNLFQALPDDVFILISRSLRPKDVCTLSSCCKSLNSIGASDKVWLAQCESVGVLGYEDLVEWRKGVSSYKSLCKFLFRVRPLIGIWVHQNPELGNVVYVMPGFISVIGCRIIPQELGALGIEDSPLLWAPVFEIIGDSEGSMIFLLHGREGGVDYMYPGFIKSVESSCNVLLLEVEPRNQQQQTTRGGKLSHSKSLVHCNSDQELLKRVYRSNSGILRLQRVVRTNSSLVSFSQLAFGDRRKLLEIVTDQVRLKVPDVANGPLLPGLRNDDGSLLSDRRLLLLLMHRLGEGYGNPQETHQLALDPTQLESSKIKKHFDRPSSFHGSLNGDEVHLPSSKRRTVVGYFKYLRVMLGKSGMANDSSEISASGSSSSEKRYAQLREFLRSSDTIGLTLKASTMKLSTYRAWPNMHDNRFALYKLPVRVPAAGHEYAGLWGGTFGWPPGKPTEDKPGKALFFLLLSYEESEGQQLLIATKILEGTHYVLHPNGSAMFVVKVDEMSFDPFPWEANGARVDVRHSYNGEGIANGYGFRYPGSKPGSLFVIRDGFLAFVWKDSRAVLTLQRLNLQDLLKKGERVPTLPPIVNFAYLTKSYSNVFTSFCNTTNSLSSPRDWGGDRETTMRRRRRNGGGVLQRRRKRRRDEELYDTPIETEDILEGFVNEEPLEDDKSSFCVM